MDRVVSVVCTMLILATIAYSVTPVSAQSLPEVILTCDDDAEINSVVTKMAIITCEVENPGMFQEKVSIQVESGELANAAPNSMIVAPGDVVKFQVSLRSDDAEEPGEIPVNVTATVTEVNGIPHPLGPSDSEEIIITIIEYTSCQIKYKGWGSSGVDSVASDDGVFDSGEEIGVWAVISCLSNVEAETSYQIHLIEKNMGSSSWPSGFQTPDDDCYVEIGVGSTTEEDCDFKIGTPTDLEKDWEGCIVIIEKGDVRPNICTSEMSLVVEKKSIGLGIEFGGNGSIIDQLGLTEEQIPVIGGILGIFLVTIVGLMYYRRKGREYE